MWDLGKSEASCWTGGKNKFLLSAFSNLDLVYLCIEVYTVEPPVIHVCALTHMCMLVYLYIYVYVWRGQMSNSIVIPQDLFILFYKIVTH